MVSCEERDHLWRLDEMLHEDRGEFDKVCGATSTRYVVVRGTTDHGVDSVAHLVEERFDFVPSEQAWTLVAATRTGKVAHKYDNGKLISSRSFTLLKRGSLQWVAIAFSTEVFGT